MKSALQEEFDYVHADCGFEADEICECYWNIAYRELLTAKHEFPLYVRTEYYDRTSAIVHRHNDFLALHIVRSGRGTHIFNDRAQSVARGDIFLMPPGSKQCFRSPVDLKVDAIYFQERLWTPREWEILSDLRDLAIFFSDAPQTSAERDHSDYFGHLSPEPHARVEATLTKMRRGLRRGDLPQHLAARALFFALMVQLAEWKTNRTFTARPNRGAGITEVLSFCDRNFHRPISNEQLAGLMHFSEPHFREVFTREVGMPPGSYLRHLRLHHAQKLLENTKVPIADVAQLSGFGDSTLLARAFKKAFGVSPLHFRRKT